MKAEAILSYLKKKFPEAILDSDLRVKQPYVLITASSLPEICRFLLREEDMYFDFLHCISGVDVGPEAGEFQVVYHLSSLIHEHQLVLKVKIPRADGPALPSVSEIWKAAEWHEREVYDMFGIPFENHPDLRRILLPDDWKGYPLRKDYEEAETYHDIKIKY